MPHKIIADFDTRRGAETAVEHLVQEHGIDRSAIVVRAAGTDNSSGTRRAGADAESGHAGVERHGDPELSGPIEVAVTCPEDRTNSLQSALKKDGAMRLRAA